MKNWIAVLVIVCLCGGVQAQTPRATANEVPPGTAIEPFRIADNLYYVGTASLAVYLLTSTEGHILINATYPSSIPLVIESIETLGFAPEDVVYLLISHGHPDHASGLAALKAATGARVLVMDDDVGVLRSGGRTDFQYPEQEVYDPAPIDAMLLDGDHVRLGNLDLEALKTPGHTRGCTTWHFTVMDAGVSRDVVILCSINFNPGYVLVGNKQWPGIIAGFEHTYQVMDGLHPDIWLAPHPFMFGMSERLERLGSGINPFVDPEGYRAYVAARHEDFRKELQRQRAASQD